MKKIFTGLLAATLVAACLVSCEKEKDKEKTQDDPIENPTDSVQFNTGSAIKVPIVERGGKAGHYDAMTIYDNASRLYYRESRENFYTYSTLVAGAYYQFRDTVERKMALRGDLAVRVPDGIHPEGPGDWVYRRDVLLTVFLNEDGSVFDLTPWKDIPWYNIPDSATLERAEEFWSLYDKVCNNLDTVAYIPNAVMDSMQPLMERAFYEQDWAGCYDMFENGYKFIPVSGAEYRELVRQGLN